MRKAIRIVSTLVLAYSIISAVFGIPSALMMLSNTANYTADILAAFPLLTAEEAEFVVRVSATVNLVESGLSVLGLGFLVYFIRNAFAESFKGKKAMLFSIPCFICLYLPVAILLLIHGGKTLHDSPAERHLDENKEE